MALLLTVLPRLAFGAPMSAALTERELVTLPTRKPIEADSLPDPVRSPLMPFNASVRCVLSATLFPDALPVADTVKNGSPATRLGSGPKLIVCANFTLKDCATGAAARQSALPARLAAIVHRPTPKMSRCCR